MQKNEWVQDSVVGIATRYSLECSGFEPQYAQKIFLFSLSDPSRPALGSARHPVQWVQGCVYLRTRTPPVLSITSLVFHEADRHKL
jgi:hypothetical protein